MWIPTTALAAAPIALPTYDPARSLAPLVDAVSPAVVTLEVESVGHLPDLPPELLERLPFDPHGLPQSRSGEGSGFFVSADGEVLTNYHVVADATSIVAVTADGRRLPATVLGGDRALDVALLRVDAAEPWLALGDSDALRVGDWVLAMGNGLGLGVSATVGIVSGRGRAVSREPLAADFVQTDAAINEGNSGGPLFSLDGAVVGMSTATIMGANTIGFAIPANRIRAVLDDLRTTGHVRRGYLGLAPDDAEGGGALVASVQADAPAAAAGLAAGDRILTVDGQPIDDARDLVVTVSSLPPGHRAAIGLERGGKARTVEVELGARPDDEAAAAPAAPPPEARVTTVEDRTLHGLTVRSSSDDPGVLVAAVSSASPFRDRLRRGDRVLAVNHHPVATASEVAHVLAHSGGDVTVEFERDGVKKVVVTSLAAE